MNDLLVDQHAWLREKDGEGGGIVPVSHDDGTILLGLVQGVVPRRGVVVVAGAQDGKLLLNVLLEREDDGYGRHENVAHKRLDQVGEDGGQAKLKLSAFMKTSLRSVNWDRRT